MMIMTQPHQQKRPSLQGTKFGGNYLTRLGLGEAFGYGADFKSKFDVAVDNKIDGAVHDFILYESIYALHVPSYKVIPDTSANSRNCQHCQVFQIRLE